MRLGGRALEAEGTVRTKIGRQAPGGEVGGAGAE